MISIFYLAPALLTLTNSLSLLPSGLLDEPKPTATSPHSTPAARHGATATARPHLTDVATPTPPPPAPSSGLACRHAAVPPAGSRPRLGLEIESGDLSLQIGGTGEVRKTKGTEPTSRCSDLVKTEAEEAKGAAEQGPPALGVGVVFAGAGYLGRPPTLAL